MNRKILVPILIFLLAFKANAQEGVSTIGIYGNLGVPVYTNFLFKPSFGGYGDLGVKLNLSESFSLNGDINGVFFRKLMDSVDFVSNYYSQIAAIGVSLMYEKSLSSDWFIGLSAGLNLGLFYGSAFSYSESIYLEVIDKTDYQIQEPVYGYKFSVNARKILDRNFDLLFGVTYSDPQFNFLDMYDNVNFEKKNDVYVIATAGVLLKLYTNKKRMPKKPFSRKIRCPKV